MMPRSSLLALPPLFAVGADWACVRRMASLWRKDDE